jgi:RNase adapter protein RapZ
VKTYNIIIITGYSGSGKSTAIAALEDAGYYCVDNMPIALLPKFLELPIERDFKMAGLAFVMDAREKGFLVSHAAIFESLKIQGYAFKILFLEADEDVLIHRYSQTRRHHPLSRDKNLTDSIRMEKEQLKVLRTAADLVINTSNCNVHELKSMIQDIAQKSGVLSSIHITVLSFGFKFGIPKDADLVMDVRFISNPFFVPELKPLDGTSQGVKAHVLENAECQEFMRRYLDLLTYLVPLYEKEGKAYLTLAVGCTGGRHRSVAVAAEIGELLGKQYPSKRIEVRHRDISLT